MAERKASNKYYPPEWDPSKGSLNTFHGQHHLRERAKKIGEGILVVRFEMPFDVWCNGCGEHVGKGVRYNAEKKAVGKYLSSKIWNFRMKCHLCDNYFEIETDPKGNDYTCKDGLRKKHEEWVPQPEDHVAILPSEEETKRIADDPFYKLENQAKDLKQTSDAAPRLQKLKAQQDSVAKDDFATSYIMRKKFREEKKEAAKLSQEAQRRGLNLTLLPPSAADAAIAERVVFQRTDLSAAQLSAIKRREVRSQSIFADSTPSSTLALKRKADLLALPLRPETPRVTSVVAVPRVVPRPSGA